MGIKSEPIIKNVAVDNNTVFLNNKGEVKTYPIFKPFLDNLFSIANFVNNNSTMLEVCNSLTGQNNSLSSPIDLNYNSTLGSLEIPIINASQNIYITPTTGQTYNINNILINKFTFGLTNTGASFTLHYTDGTSWTSPYHWGPNGTTTTFTDINPYPLKPVSSIVSIISGANWVNGGLTYYYTDLINSKLTGNINLTSSINLTGTSTKLYLSSDMSNNSNSNITFEISDGTNNILNQTANHLIDISTLSSGLLTLKIIFSKNSINDNSSILKNIAILILD